jgi:hypothetical protein
MAERIIELLYRNLQEVFGEDDAARRRAAIADFYTEDCVLYVPPGAHVRHDALDKFRAARDTSALRLHAPWRGTGPAQWRNSGLEFRPEERGSGLYRTGCRHCSRRQDRRALRISQPQI